MSNRSESSPLLQTNASSVSFPSFFSVTPTPMAPEISSHAAADRGMMAGSEEREDGSDSLQIGDPFVPFDDADAAPDFNIVTLRAVLLGSLCGAVINAANIYLGLKTGWTSGANLVGSVVGFALLKRWAANSSLPFGSHENNIVQTVATAAGGMSSVFISAIPALYQLGLMRTPSEDFGRILILTGMGGFFGTFCVVPLRGMFIHKLARELTLIFPTNMATAVTIRSMHSASSGGKAAIAKIKSTLYAFIGAVVLRVASQYATGILWDWHVFTWAYSAGIFSTFAIAAESWGWILEWSPAMFGSGMLVGTDVALSFFLGGVLAWGIVGPYLVSHEIAFGEPATEDPQWSGLMSYTSMTTEFTNVEHPSPRFWILWPGVACMLAVSFAELACHWRILWAFARSAIDSFKSTYYKMLHKTSSEYSRISGSDEIDSQDEDRHDNGMQVAEIATWMWAPGLAAVVIIGCTITAAQFDMTVVTTLLSLALAFIMSLVAIQATGATDTTPLSSVSKVAQVLLATTNHGPGATVASSQRLSLLGGGLTSVGASQATDLIGDFRVGFLLQTPPVPQYLAQLIGTLVAVFVAPAVFVLYTTAYPCIIARPDDSSAAASAGGSAATCEFAGPAITAWRAVAVASSSSESLVPASSLRFSFAMAGGGVGMVLVRHWLWRGKWAFMRSYHPNMMILALPFTLPSPQYGVTMMMGAALARLWRWSRTEGWERHGVAIAAGLVAGEGIGGAVNCVLTLAGVSGQGLGTTVGCPAGMC